MQVLDTQTVLLHDFVFHSPFCSLHATNTVHVCLFSSANHHRISREKKTLSWQSKGWSTMYVLFLKKAVNPIHSPHEPWFFILNFTKLVRFRIKTAYMVKSYVFTACFFYWSQLHCALQSTDWPHCFLVSFAPRSLQTRSYSLQSVSTKAESRRATHFAAIYPA